jgi:hypothetical protein
VLKFQTTPLILISRLFGRIWNWAYLVEINQRQRSTLSTRTRVWSAADIFLSPSSAFSARHLLGSLIITRRLILQRNPILASNLWAVTEQLCLQNSRLTKIVSNGEKNFCNLTDRIQEKTLINPYTTYRFNTKPSPVKFPLKAPVTSLQRVRQV